jgi:hypothetical protein
VCYFIQASPNEESEASGPGHDDGQGGQDDDDYLAASQRTTSAKAYQNFPIDGAPNGAVGRRHGRVVAHSEVLFW